MNGDLEQFRKTLTAINSVSGAAQGMLKEFESASVSMKAYSKNISDMNTGVDQFNKSLAAVGQIAATTQSLMKEFDQATTGMKAYNKNLADVSKIYQAQLDAFRKN